MSKSLTNRIDKLEQSAPIDDREKITDIGFILPDDKAFNQFGIEFESIEHCIKYCDANDIPYMKEKGPFGMDSYQFPIEH